MLMLDIIPLTSKACVRQYHYSRFTTLTTGVTKNLCNDTVFFLRSALCWWRSFMVDSSSETESQNYRKAESQDGGGWKVSLQMI